MAYPSLGASGSEEGSNGCRIELRNSYLSRLTTYFQASELERVNMERAIYVPPGGPPRVAPPNPAIYAAMGEEKIFAMIRDFYQELAQSWLHPIMFPDDPDDLRAAADKSAAFFVGLLGGPPLYQQRYGNPMMRARHMPFAIDEAARQEWLRCFALILEDAPARYNFPAQHLFGFWAFLEGFSSWMVNTATPPLNQK